MRIVAALLICCLLMTTIGYHFAFRMQMGQLKTAMKRSLRQKRNRKDVVELSFDHVEAQQLQWVDEQEFSWKGEMYDVIEKRVEKEKLVIVCISDKQEDKLLKEYQKNTRNSHSQARASWIKLMTAPFLLPDGLLPVPYSSIIKFDFVRWVSPVTFLPRSIFTPPPEVC